MPEIRSFEQDLDGLKVQCWEIKDESSGLLAFLSVVERSERPAFGGIRRQRYASVASAFVESQILAIQMAQKLAFADLDHGGAKMVIVDSDDFRPAAAYPIVGEFIQSLNGRYFCGPDVGTGEKELAFLRTKTEFVNHVSNDAGRATAAGVLAGMKAAVRHLGWVEGLMNRRVLIQGLGSVGGAMAQELAALGAHILLLDLDERRAESLLQELLQHGNKGEVIAPVQLQDVAADVFCPCAVGDAVDETCDRFALVCGSANLQVMSPEVEAHLFRQGCLYVPEIAVNAGAVIEGVIRVRATHESQSSSQGHITATEERVQNLLRLAQEKGQSPHAWIQEWWQNVRP